MARWPTAAVKSYQGAHLHQHLIARESSTDQLSRLPRASLSATSHHEQPRHGHWCLNVDVYEAPTLGLLLAPGPLLAGLSRTVVVFFYPPLFACDSISTSTQAFPLMPAAFHA